jgi:nicotinate (nicotinamide) nucleotide adenylyltransferase
MHRKSRPRFVVFGGTFNPIHVGHLEIIRCLSAREDVDQVLVIPAGMSPFKPAATLLPADLRYRLVREAVSGLARVAVLDLEVRRPPPSRTLETLLELGALYPRAELRLALGQDVYEGFGRWWGAAAILERAGLLVFPRRDAPAAPSHPPARDGAALPEPWKARARPDATQRLADPTGRVLAEWVAASIPPVSASTILQARDLGQVAPGAREALAAYWRQESPVSGP